jgi:hypothetical protein
MNKVGTNYKQFDHNYDYHDSHVQTLPKSGTMLHTNTKECTLFAEEQMNSGTLATCRVVSSGI